MGLAKRPFFAFRAAIAAFLGFLHASNSDALLSLATGENLFWTRVIV